jgi:hypothetical protein
MIEQHEDGSVVLDYTDWTKAMMRLSLALLKLPREHPGHDRLHELGIDRLSHMPNGHRLINLLLADVQELQKRPDDQEVLALAEAIARIAPDLQELVQNHPSFVPDPVPDAKAIKAAKAKVSKEAKAAQTREVNKAKADQYARRKAAALEEYEAQRRAREQEDEEEEYERKSATPDAIIQILLEHCYHRLNVWEKKFLPSIRGRHSLSEKQEAKLEQIAQNRGAWDFVPVTDERGTDKYECGCPRPTQRFGFVRKA